VRSLRCGIVDFGLQGLPQDAAGADRLSRYAGVLDLLPSEFSTVWIDDHLQFETRPTMEGWTFLTYLAALHPRFRFGHLVLCQSFRNPALLAKMAATLQRLTGGRYILGIGAGWHEEEYRAYGYDYPSGGVRVEQLAEAIEVIRAVWNGSPGTYEGSWYRVDGAYCEPRPDPPIPIMVGTNGPKALRVTARLADWWNWDGPWETTYRRPYELLRRRCEEVGRPFEEITLTAGLPVSFPGDPSTFQSTYEHHFYPGQVFGIVGPTPDDAITEIGVLVDAGVSHFQVVFDDMVTLRRFVADVVPAFRTAVASA
jgi:alkanesulfonate monooxygenase SsuD/methylene tetrahydromethanopterin reductase-like flavin-dependent oxidoreductase (luciferase family)